VPRLKEATEVPETEIEGLGLVRVGRKVIHPVFGAGIIEGLYIWGDGRTKTVRVLFRKHGSKAFAPAYAGLKLADDA
jgi:hypothetical protein